MKFSEHYGSWAVVAGASQGLGAEYAYQLAERGLNVVLVARRKEMLQSLANQLMKKFGGSNQAPCSGPGRGAP